MEERIEIILKGTIGNVLCTEREFLELSRRTEVVSLNVKVVDGIKRRTKKMEQYEKYMERRSELIKQGKGLAESTNTAFEEVYQHKISGEDLIGPANQ